MLQGLVNSIPHGDAFECFCGKQSRPDEAALEELAKHGISCLWKCNLSNPILVDLTSNSFVLCTNMKNYLYNYS